MRKHRIGCIAGALCLAASVTFADFAVNENLTLTGDLEWQYRGKMTLADGVTIDLAGHTLSVGDLAGNGLITNSAAGTPAELHVYVPHESTYGNATVAIGGNLKLVKEGGGCFAPTKEGQSYTGGTEIAGGTLRCWRNHYPGPFSKGQLPGAFVGPGSIFDIDGAPATYRHGTVDTGNWYTLCGGTLCNNGTDITTGWSQLDHIRLTADSAITSPYSWGLIGGGYGATDLDLAGHTVTISIAAQKSFYLWNADVTAGTLKTISGGDLNLDKSSVRGANTTLDLDSSVSVCVPATFGTVIARYTGTTATGNGSLLAIRSRFQPVSNYINRFQLLNGATLDLSARTDAYPLTGSTGQTLAFAANATITVDISGRILDDQTQIVSWSAAPSGVTFVLDVESARAYDLVSSGTGLAVTRKAQYPATATWTGAGDANDPTDPANWSCADVHGAAVAAAPCVLTTIILGTAETMNVPQGTKLFCASLASAADAALAADCDWCGLVCVNLATTLDLKGFKLRLADLRGSGTVTDTSADANAPGELHIDVPAGLTVENAAVTLTGNLRLVKDGAGTYSATKDNQTGYTGKTHVTAGRLKASTARAAEPVTVDAGAVFDYDPYTDLRTIWRCYGGPHTLNGGTLYQEWADLGNGLAQMHGVTLTADSSFVSPYSCGFVGSGYKAITLDLGGKTLDVQLGRTDAMSSLWLANVTATKGTIRSGDSTILSFYQTSFRGGETTLDIAGGLATLVPVTVSNLVVRTCMTTASGANGSGMLTVLGTFTPVSDWLHNFTLASGATLDLNRRFDPFNLTSPLTGKTLGFAANAAVTLDIHARPDTNFTQLVAWTARPSGVTFALDAQSAAEGRHIVVDATGIYLYPTGVVCVATWTGAVDGDFAKSGNWVCKDVEGTVLPDALPTAETFVHLPGSLAFASLTDSSFPHLGVVIDTATLTADADWTGLGNTLNIGGTLDLAGHKLTLATLNGVGTVTDSTTDAPGELHLVVPAETTCGNSTVTLTGNLKFVKEGEGLFAPTKTGQSYTGGTELAGGTMKAWESHHPANDFVIDAGATLDIDGANATYRNGYNEDWYTLNGGTLVNQTSDITWNSLYKVRLQADSTIRAICSFGFLGIAYAETFLSLNGHTLTVEIASGKTFDIWNCTMNAGTLKTTGAGILRFRTNKQSVSRLAETTLDLGTGISLQRGFSVRDLILRYAGTAGSRSADQTILVQGTLTPVSDYIYFMQLEDGATINLREKTGTWSTTSETTQQTLGFAANATITLDLAGRADLATNLKVLSFGEELPASVRFKLDETTHKKFLAIRHADGIYLQSSGLHLFIR